MNLKKRKHFTLKKEDSFLMNLFLSSYFSFQTRTDLVLAKFYFSAAVRHFLKTFRKIAGKRLWWKPYLGKFKLFKVDSGKGVFLSVFRAHVSGCFQTLNSIHLNDNTVWCIYSRVIKDLSKSGGFFLLNALKYSGESQFHSPYAQSLHIFWNILLKKTKTKKNVKLKKLFCKDKSSESSS